MQFEIYKPADRGLKDLGWLKSSFVFSFSGYYNPVRAGFGLLRVFNDDYVQPENGFGIHPHANM
jgi:redox-sensitive bicupin YhaK (pirin superfamily)